MATASLRDLEAIGHGSSGIVFAIDDKSVIKVPAGGQAGAMELDVESRIYRRLDRHPRVLQYLGTKPQGGLILERLRCPLRCRLQKLHMEARVPSNTLLRKWSYQAIEGLQYLHSKQVLQGDVGCHNLLLDDGDDLKYCDFAGSSIDGQETLVCYETRSQRPSDAYATLSDDTSVLTEIFALGTMLFEMSTTEPPYANESGVRVTELFLAKSFPVR